jgi:hypothetical protein
MAKSKATADSKAYVERAFSASCLDSKGFDKGVNSPLTYLKSSHFPVVFAIAFYSTARRAKGSAQKDFGLWTAHYTKRRNNSGVEVNCTGFGALYVPDHAALQNLQD